MPDDFVIAIASGKGGTGRGGGMGRGMGMPSTGSAASFPQGAGPQSREQELAALKQQAELLKQQKHQLNNRIARLERGRKRKDVAVVDSEKCTGCGICADVCPVNAITIKGQAVVNPDVCTGCAACVYECPNAAIIITLQKIGT